MYVLIINKLLNYLYNWHLQSILASFKIQIKKVNRRFQNANLIIQIYELIDKCNICGKGNNVIREGTCKTMQVS